MADSSNRTDGRGGQPTVEDAERRLVETTQLTGGPETRASEEKTSGVKGVVGLQMGMFFPVVILGVIFLAAIILFAVMR